MLGAVVGDVIGSAYEFSPMKDYDFVLFSAASKFTDDTVQTCAIADVVINRDVYGYCPFGSRQNWQAALRLWCKRYPDAGYGKGFKAWLANPEPKPYQSIGNGSAMRVSPLGYCWTKDHAKEQARHSASVTHDSESGISGACAVATAIWLARQHGVTKDAIAKEISGSYGYDLSKPLSEIRPTNVVDTTCQGSVPQALRAFLESTDFESAVRLAVSLGGDCDTQGAIAGSVAEAFYKEIPEEIVIETLARLPREMVDVVLKFAAYYDRPVFS